MQKSRKISFPVLLKISPSFLMIFLLIVLFTFQSLDFDILKYDIIVAIIFFFLLIIFSSTYHFFKSYFLLKYGEVSVGKIFEYKEIKSGNGRGSTYKFNIEFRDLYGNVVKSKISTKINPIPNIVIPFGSFIDFNKIYEHKKYYDEQMDLIKNMLLSKQEFKEKKENILKVLSEKGDLESKKYSIQFEEILKKEYPLIYNPNNTSKIMMFSDFGENIQITDTDVFIITN